MRLTQPSTFPPKNIQSNHNLHFKFKIFEFQCYDKSARPSVETLSKFSGVYCSRVNNTVYSWLVSIVRAVIFGAVGSLEFTGNVIRVLVIVSHV